MEYIRCTISKESYIEDVKIAYKNLANCYIFKNKRDKDLNALLKPLEIDIPRGNCCCMIGEMLLERNIINGVIFWCEAALTLELSMDNSALMERAYFTWIPHLQLCVAYFKIGNLEKLIYHNEEAGRYIPNSPKIEYNRSLFIKIKANINKEYH